MRAAVLRYIDKWVGISLCYLLTVLDNVRRVLFPTDDHYKPSKILFLSVVELGALSVAFSAINSAKRNFPEAKVYIFTTSLGEELCEIMGFGSEQRIIISSVENPWRFMWDSFKAVFKLNRIGIDAAVCLEPYLRYSAIMSYLSGSKIRSGFHRFSEEGNYIGNLFTHKLIYNPHLHVGLSYMSLVEALKERTDHEPKVKRPIQYAELERFVARHTSTGLAAIREVIKKHYPEVEGKKIIILNPNGKDRQDLPLRRWPDDNYVELARTLLDHYNVLIVLTGAGSEISHNQEIIKRINMPEVINLAGKINITELLHLYYVSDLLVTNDSGPAHFASMTSIPIIVFYGPETPEIFGALSPNARLVYKHFACSPCLSVYNGKNSKCTDNQCLQAITVSEVFSLTKEILAHRPGQLSG